MGWEAVTTNIKDKRLTLRWFWCSASLVWVQILRHSLVSFPFRMSHRNQICLSATSNQETGPCRYLFIDIGLKSSELWCLGDKNEMVGSTTNFGWFPQIVFRLQYKKGLNPSRTDLLRKRLGGWGAWRLKSSPSQGEHTTGKWSSINLRGQPLSLCWLLGCACMG